MCVCACVCVERFIDSHSDLIEVCLPHSRNLDFFSHLDPHSLLVMVINGVCNTRGAINSPKYAYSDHLFVMASTDVRSKDSILLKERV